MTPTFLTKLLFIPLAIVCMCTSSASAQILVKGEVRTEQGEKIDFASVGIQQEGKTLAFLMTDEGGNWEANLPAAGTYLIITSQLGYGIDSTTHQLKNGSFVKQVLNIEIKALDQVTVTAKKPVITQKVDRFIVDIENSYLSSGYNAFELFRKLPGIWINTDGVIKLQGSKSVAVQINGVLQRMSYEELTVFLQGLNAENIARIEVITNPGAEYDAEGASGFVNIILKKVYLDGWSGSISCNYRQQKEWPNVRPNASIQYKRGKFNAFARYGFAYQQNVHYARNNVTYPNGEFYNTNTDLNEYTRRHQVITGMVYDLDSKQSMGVQYIYSNNYERTQFDTYMNFNFGGLPTEGRALVDHPEGSSRHNATVNYSLKTDTLGSSLTIIGDFAQSRLQDDSDFSSAFSRSELDSSYRSKAPYLTELYSVQSDFNKVFKNGQTIKVGLKYSQIDRNNILNTDILTAEGWKPDPGFSNEFLYQERIYAAYISHSRKWWASDIVLGFRSELTQINGNSITSNQSFDRYYINYFPYLTFQKVLNSEKNHILTFSFNTPLNRPDYSILNPYRLRVDNYTYQIGNPDLRPQISYNGDLGFILNGKYSIGVFYRRTTDVFARLLNVANERIIEYQYRNFSFSQEYGMFAYLPFSPTKWWNFSLLVHANHLNFTLPGFVNKNYAVYCNTNQSFSISKIVDIDLYGEYRSPYVYANAIAAYQFFADASLSKRFFENKLKVSLVVTDLFNTLRDKVDTDFNNTVVNFYQKRITRTFGININYKFRIGKPFEAREVEEGANQEKERMN